MYFYHLHIHIYRPDKIHTHILPQFTKSFTYLHDTMNFSTHLHIHIYCPDKIHTHILLQYSICLKRK